MKELIVDIGCGSSHTMIVTASGLLYGTGDNSSAQLGTGNKLSSSKFIKIEEMSSMKVKKVACGQYTASITLEGSLYIWGTGVFGEYLSAKKIENIGGKIKDVCIGSSFGLLLDEYGKIWTWGENTSGELGVGDYEPRTEPFYLSKLQSKTVTAIACGGSFAITLGVTHRGLSKKPEIIEEEIKQPKEVAELSDHGLEEQENVLERTPSVSDLNNAEIEVSSSVSQRDPNQHLLNVLTKQRDYLEECLEKERKDKKKADEVICSLKAENTKLRNYADQVEAQKAKEINDAKTILNDFTLTKKRLEAAQPKIEELENNNILLSQIVKDKDAKLGELHRSLDEIQKKYSAAKAKLKGHSDIEKKLAKENENLLDKIKKIENEKATELLEQKEVNEQLLSKINEYETQLKEVKSSKQKQDERVKEFEIGSEEYKKTVDQLHEHIEQLEKEKEQALNDFTKQKNLSMQYEGDLNYLEKEFDTIKKTIQSQNEEIKAEVTAEKIKTEELQYQNKQQEVKIQELQFEKDTMAQKIIKLEQDLKESATKLVEFKRLNEDLEDRNYKLMDSLHQDVNNRAKQYKGKTLAALAQSEAHKVLIEMKEPTFSFREGDKPVVKGSSPPQNLVVESTDDITQFDSIVKSSKQSPTKDRSKLFDTLNQSKSTFSIV